MSLKVENWCKQSRVTVFPPPPPPPQTPTQQASHTVSTIKLSILKKGEYDIWAMKIEHYLSHTDYPIWEVIQKGNGPVSVSTDTNGVIKVLPPKTAKEILARERERKARTTLLMALPEDHLAKFHKMTDAKEMWDAIKSRFGEGLHKGYDRFQSLLSQLEIHGAGVFTEDANQKFLRSLPSFWSQNVAFVSSESTSSTNDVSIAYGVSTSSGYNLQRENSSSYTDELKYSFFANQSSGPHLHHEDLEQLDEFDLEEMDLKWQVAMISMRLKKFYKKTECRSKGNQKSKRRDAGNTGYRAKDNGRRPGKQEEPKALVTLDGEGVDWTGHAEDEQENFALMAYSNSGSDTEVKSCSKECVESYAKLKKLYDEQREQLGDASIEIQAYTQALKKVEAQLVAHQKNQLWYEEKIRFMKIDLDDKTDVLTYHKKLLAEAVKEKEELKTKLENFQSSSKGLSKANQSSGPQLDYEDLELLDEYDLEEMDLKWQFDAKEPVGFDKTKVECFNCHKTGHFARECISKGNQDIRRRDAGNTGYKAKDNGRRLGKQEEPKALVTLDEDGVDWTGHSEDEQENFALMAYNNSGSDTENKSLSLAFANDDKTDVFTYHKKLLAEAVKEKEELKTKYAEIKKDETTRT
ncbi:ribonuclease H-like domain-containing protein [Tanacetum coccineum]